MNLGSDISMKISLIDIFDIPRDTKGSVNPPASYRAPPTVGPTIIPMPKKVSRMANMVATLSGNSLAIMLKDPVRNPLFPQASIILKSQI